MHLATARILQQKLNNRIFVNPGSTDSKEMKEHTITTNCSIYTNRAQFSMLKFHYNYKYRLICGGFILMKNTAYIERSSGG